jgi:hypothetical protein
MFELLRNTLHIWEIHRALRFLFFIRIIATLGFNGRANETLGLREGRVVGSAE